MVMQRQQNVPVPLKGFLFFMFCRLFHYLFFLLLFFLLLHQKRKRPTAINSNVKLL